MHADTSGSLDGHPKDGRYKTPRGTYPWNHLPQPTNPYPLDLHFNHYIVTMFTGGLPGFNINDITAFDNKNYDDKFSFDGFDWEILSNVAGPSQPYTGVDVQGDLNAYPEFPSPSSAPTSLYPAQGAIPSEGKLCCTS